MRRWKISTGLLGESARSYYRERRIMRREFRTSLMSDTKWRKLFLAIERLKLALPICRVKWIFGEEPEMLRTPTSKTLYPPRPFIDSFEFGPFALCSVEWLEFPRVVTHDSRDGHGRVTYHQDVDRAEQALKVVARFPMENTPDGLRIVGHAR
jgi:hypothetical protein